MKPLPGALPSWMSLRRVTTAVHGLGLITLLVPSIVHIATEYWPLPPGSHWLPWIGLIVGIPLTLSAAIGTSLLVGRARTAQGALLRSVLGSVSTFLTLPFVAAFHAWANGGLGETFSDRFVYGVHMMNAPYAYYLFLGALGSVFYGALTGVLLALPVMWAHRHAQAAVSGRALLRISAWMALPAALSLIGVVMAGHAVAWAVLAMLAVTWSLALTAGGVGAALYLRRARWLASVREGNDAKYRIRVATDADAPLPGLGTSVQTDDEVIEELVESDATPYRAAKLAMPVARVNR